MEAQSNSTAEKEKEETTTKGDEPMETEQEKDKEEVNMMIQTTRTRTEMLAMRSCLQFDSEYFPYIFYAPNSRAVNDGHASEEIGICVNFSKFLNTH